MCNCGNKRRQLNPGSHSAGNTAEAGVYSKMWQDIEFKYTGLTSLTVTGSVTGKRYRFYHTHDVQKIDHRDAGGMMAVPVLKRVINF